MFSIKERNRNKLLYIPLEIYDRELDGALLSSRSCQKRLGGSVLEISRRNNKEHGNNLPGVSAFKTYNSWANQNPKKN